MESGLAHRVLRERGGMVRGSCALAVLLAGVMVVATGGAAAAPGTPARVSIASDGTQAGAASRQVSVSGDGQVVAFISDATNLVAGDTNGVADAFVHDRSDGSTERVSVASDETQGNDASTTDPNTKGSFDTSISGNGRYAVFSSASSNLVSSDANVSRDVFVRDLVDGTTVRVSLSSLNAEGGGDSVRPTISNDGRFVVFDSYAPFDAETGLDLDGDVFVRDRDTDADGVFDEVGAVSTVRVSVSTSGTEADDDSRYATVSDDGRYVAFQSRATNLVAGDTNGTWDVFLRDRDTDGDGVFDESGAVSTARLSVASDGTEGNGQSIEPGITADGSLVVFGSSASNLVAGDTNGAHDIFVHDVAAGTTTRVSVTSGGAQASGSSEAAEISDDGRYVAFESSASNLVTGDTNGARDVFVHDRQAGETVRASVDASGDQGNGASTGASLAGNGLDVAFQSTASDLVTGDTNGVADAFVIDLDAAPPSTTTTTTTAPTTTTTTSTTTTTTAPTTTTTTTAPTTTTTTTAPTTTTTTSSTTTSTTTTTQPGSTSGTTTTSTSTTAPTTTTTAAARRATPSTTTTVAAATPPRDEAGASPPGSAGTPAPAAEGSAVRDGVGRSRTAPAGDEPREDATESGEHGAASLLGDREMIATISALGLAGAVIGGTKLGLVTWGWLLVLLPMRRRRRPTDDASTRG